ncbi:MAG: TonB-dependent receptor [Candidatus Eutrophobiaceae bacterium]
MNIKSICRQIGAAALCIVAHSVCLAETVNPSKIVEDPDIVVIGITPLPAKGMSLEKYPSNAQSWSADDLDQFKNLEITDGLAKLSGSFSLNAAQNNPYQNDLFYRGFLASPLVGTSNGLSVYLDGVRINEAFGGTLNWDLVPESAIATIDVVPGSNPLFGLNALGGALSMRTKSGSAYEGTRMEGLFGSFNRRAVEFEHGGQYGDMDFYINLDGLDEDGWRVRSPSEVRRLFTKIGWENDRTDIDVSFARGANTLIGNGFVPERTLQLNREAVHTYPDHTENNMDFVTLNLSHLLTDELQVSTNFYHRGFERNTLNGDAEVGCSVDIDGEEYGVFVDDEGENSVHLALCNGTLGDLGETVDESLEPALINEDDGEMAQLSGNEEAELKLEAGGEERKSTTDSDSQGMTLQLSHSGALNESLFNTLTVGFAYDLHKTDFSQFEAEASLGAPDPSYSRGVINPGEYQEEVNISTEQDNYGYFFTNTLEIDDQWSLTVSGRYQKVDLDIKNNFELEEGEEDKLSGSHSFERFNPAAGVAWQTGAMLGLTLFANYSEGFRVPTAAELTCADPDDPCNLPNAFVADPPLNPIIAKTYEMGARGKAEGLGFMDRMSWNLAFFRTDLKDDLYFIHTRASGAGYFQNIGDTRRQGVEFNFSGGAGLLDVYFSYSYLEATIETDVTLASVNVYEGVEVRAGSTLPSIPAHNYRVGASLMPMENWVISTNVRASTGVYQRGDEANAFAKLDGYAVCDFNTVFQLHENVSIWGKVENVLDAEYETAGIRNWNANIDVRDADGEIEVENFLAPGAPRSGWVGITLNF